MARIIKINGLGTFYWKEDPDHKCNEEASIYTDSDGGSYFFNDSNKADEFLKNTSLNIVSGSVACSICKKSYIPF